jgi:hypothetical protein
VVGSPSPGPFGGPAAGKGTVGHRLLQERRWPTRAFSGSVRSSKTALRKRHVIVEEGARGLGVEAVDHVCRAAHGVAGDRDGRDDAGVAEEVGAAGVAVAGAAVAVDAFIEMRSQVLLVAFSVPVEYWRTSS